MKNKKKILIVINNLLCGGAQKSLVSLLNCIEPDYYDLDLLVLNRNNIFFDNIPKWVNIVEPVAEISEMYKPLKKILTSKKKDKLILKALLNKICLKITNDKKFNEVQNLWKVWKYCIPKNKIKYDLAISYVDGFSNYYVVDKVEAEKKILWVHNEYEKLSYFSEYDRKYFAKADALITISEVCVSSLKKVFPEYKNKIHLLYNLSSPKMIREMGYKEKPTEYINKINILVSIGRLNEQKGFDLAIKAAYKMKKDGLNYSWFIIGEGELEQDLRNQIDELGLNENVYLLGLRKNPYPYIQYADIFIQPSRFEGKSIVLDEAKILGKPIVATNYDTVYDSITNGVNGTICEFDENSLGDAIVTLLENIDIRYRYSTNLEKEIESDIESMSYIKLFDSI